MNNLNSKPQLNSYFNLFEKEYKNYHEFLNYFKKEYIYGTLSKLQMFNSGYNMSQTNKCCESLNALIKRELKDRKLLNLTYLIRAFVNYFKFINN